MKTLKEIKNEAAEDVYREVVIPVKEWKLLTFQQQSELTTIIAQRYSDERLKEWKEKLKIAIQSEKEPGYKNRTLILRHEEYTLACNEIIKLIDSL